jgi:mRNA interferase RelE/StbE
MSKKITYSRTALKALRQMPRPTALRIRAKIEQYAAKPESLSRNIRTLIDYDGIVRLRVGDWRIFLRDEIVLLVLEVKSRGSAYKD